MRKHASHRRQPRTSIEDEAPNTCEGEPHSEGEVPFPNYSSETCVSSRTHAHEAHTWKVTSPTVDNAITDTAGHELVDHDATMSNIERIGPMGKGGGHAEAQSKFPMRYRPAVKPRDGRKDRSETPTGYQVAEHVLTTPSFCPEKPPGMRPRGLRRHKGIGARKAPRSVPRFEAKREGLARRVRAERAARQALRWSGSLRDDQQEALSFGSTLAAARFLWGEISLR